MQTLIVLFYSEMSRLCNNVHDNATKILKKINKTKGAEHFDSFDFSTLYANIPHDLLLDSIHQLISEAYRIRGAK